MALALMLSMLVAAPTGAAMAARSDDPPIKVWLNQDSYFLQGDRARVNVKLADDGYVVVLRADADGRVRCSSRSIRARTTSCGAATRSRSAAAGSAKRSMWTTARAGASC